VGLTPDKVESTLGMTISAAIPTSSQVAHATNSGEPIVSAQPKHPVSQAINKLARSIAASGAPAADLTSAAPKGRAAAPKRSLLRRNGR
jgi:pilus assembly protein CpaE